MLLAFVPCSYNLLANTDISVAVYKEHELFVKYSRVYGLSWKLLELAADNQDLTLLPQKTTWQGSIQRLKAQKITLVFPALKTVEREKWAIFTLPILPTHSSILTLKSKFTNGEPSINFDESTIGVVKGSQQETIINETQFKHIYSTRDRSQLFTMLSKNRLDYLFLAKGAIDYYCMKYSNEKKRDCLTPVGKPYAKNFSHAIGLNIAETQLIIDKINAGFLAIKDSKKVTELFIEYGYKQSDVEIWHTTIKEG